MLLTEPCSRNGRPRSLSKRMPERRCSCSLIFRIKPSPLSSTLLSSSQNALDRSRRRSVSETSMKEMLESAEEHRVLSLFFPFDMGNPKSSEDTAKVELGYLNVTWGKPLDFAIREAETPSK